MGRPGSKKGGGSQVGARGKIPAPASSACLIGLAGTAWEAPALLVLLAGGAFLAMAALTPRCLAVRVGKANLFQGPWLANAGLGESLARFGVFSSRKLSGVLSLDCPCGRFNFCGRFLRNFRGALRLWVVKSRRNTNSARSPDKTRTI